LGDYEKSITFLKYTDSLTDPKDLKKKAKVKMDISNAYRQINRFTESLVNLVFAFNIYTETKDSFHLVDAYNALANTYNSLEFPHLAIDNYREALEINKGVQIQGIEVQIFSNIGAVYMEMPNQLDSALLFFKAGLALIDESLDDHNALILKANIGTVFLYQKKYQAAIDLFNELLKSRIITTRVHILSTVYANLSEAYYQLGDANKAYQFAQLGNDISFKTGNLKQQVLSLKTLCNVDSLRGDYQSLSKHQRDYFYLRMELYKLENNEKVSGLLSKIEIDKKTLENKLLLRNAEYQKNLLNRNGVFSRVVFASFFILLMVSSVLVMMRKRTVKLNKELNSINVITKSQ
jgi:tetratricopeptide (TPR) repeat protein